MIRTTRLFRNSKQLLAALLAAVVVLQIPQLAQAHFPWLLVEKSGEKTVLSCVFAEEPAPEDDEKLLKYLEGAKVYKLVRKADPAELTLTANGTKMSVALDDKDTEGVFVLAKDLGVMARGGAAYKVRYYSKAGPALSSRAWGLESGDIVVLDVQPKMDGGTLNVTVKANGKTVTGAEVVAYQPDALDAVKTNDAGVAEIKLNDQPLKALRVKYVEAGEGELDGKKYTETRHYTTVTFPELTYKPIVSEKSYPSIPEEITSFGAAVAGNAVYYYGGHTGGAHEYSDEGQCKTLYRLKLEPGSKWEAVAEGPRLQGLAMVAHDGKIVRLGGFTAKNKEGEEHSLWSQADVASFDPATGKWTDLAPMPEPRSSFDAAVVDGKVYVVGGWSMQGEAESQWHDTVWSLDLSQANAKWEAVPNLPTPRRALSIAAYNGKLYAIGGMTSSNGVTTKVEIYDPATKSWSNGPDLIGSGMTGFGTSSFAQGNRLYVSTYDGTLESIGAGEDKWTMEGNLENARFFHRMVPVGSNQLLLLGGSNMSVGKFGEVEVITVAPEARTAAR